MNISRYLLTNFYDIPKDHSNLIADISMATECNRGNKFNYMELTCEPCPKGTFSEKFNISDLDIECVI